MVKSIGIALWKRERQTNKESKEAAGRGAYKEVPSLAFG
jgi:hypothetical protein